MREDARRIRFVRFSRFLEEFVLEAVIYSPNGCTSRFRTSGSPRLQKIDRRDLELMLMRQSLGLIINTSSKMLCSSKTTSIIFLNSC